MFTVPGQLNVEVKYQGELWAHLLEICDFILAFQNHKLQKNLQLMMRKTVLSAKIWHQIEVTNSQLIIGLWHKTFLIVTKKMLFTPKKHLPVK